MISSRRGCPIRISLDQNLLAVPQSFSQRATSFIASWCQGIHRMPFCRSIFCPVLNIARCAMRSREPHTHITANSNEICSLPAMHRNHSSEPRNHYRNRFKSLPLGTDDLPNNQDKNSKKRFAMPAEIHAASTVITTAIPASSYI